jgi:membrane-bound inhibitor of C-type lysozyme
MRRSLMRRMAGRGVAAVPLGHKDAGVVPAVTGEGYRAWTGFSVWWSKGQE